MSSRYDHLNFFLTDLMDLAAQHKCKVDVRGPYPLLIRGSSAASITRWQDALDFLNPPVTATPIRYM